MAMIINEEDDKMGKITEKMMRDSLQSQLKAQGKVDDFYMDMVESYIFYWNMKNELEKDIKENGIRYTFTNGNGISTEKPNESILNLQKTTATMLKILSDLKLKEPTALEEDETSGYL